MRKRVDSGVWDGSYYLERIEAGAQVMIWLCLTILLAGVALTIRLATWRSRHAIMARHRDRACGVGHPDRLQHRSRRGAAPCHRACRRRGSAPAIAPGLSNSGTRVAFGGCRS